MSLEAKIEELTAALKENTAAMQALSKAPAVVNTVTIDDSGKGGDADGEKRGRGRPKKDEADAGKSNKAEPEKAAKIDDDKVREVFGGFMGVEDADERESRKTFVKDLLKVYGAAKALEIPADKREEALQKVEAEAARRKAAEAEGEEDLV